MEIIRLLNVSTLKLTRIVAVFFLAVCQPELLLHFCEHLCFIIFNAFMSTSSLSQVLYTDQVANVEGLAGEGRLLLVAGGSPEISAEKNLVVFLFETCLSEAPSQTC